MPLKEASPPSGRVVSTRRWALKPRHIFATHMLEQCVNIRLLQDLLGHADMKTIGIYTHVMARDIQRLQWHLDRLEIRPFVSSSSLVAVFLLFHFSCQTSALDLSPQKSKAGLPSSGNPARLKAPWFSVPTSQWVWLYLIILFNHIEYNEI
jgi:hypothetical protein